MSNEANAPTHRTFRNDNGESVIRYTMGAIVVEVADHPGGWDDWNCVDVIAKPDSMSETAAIRRVWGAISRGAQVRIGL